jgi:hypothetical protein
MEFFLKPATPLCAIHQLIVNVIVIGSCSRSMQRHRKNTIEVATPSSPFNATAAIARNIFILGKSLSFRPAGLW